MDLKLQNGECGRNQHLMYTNGHHVPDLNAIPVGQLEANSNGIQNFSYECLERLSRCLAGLLLV